MEQPSKAVCHPRILTGPGEIEGKRENLSGVDAALFDTAALRMSNAKTGKRVTELKVPFACNPARPH